MQSVDIEPNAEERLEKLQQDFEKPFSPPVDIKEPIPKDSPELDTGIDAHEWYDEGASGAAEVTPPRKRSILAYRPIRIAKRLIRGARGLVKNETLNRRKKEK